MTRSLLASASIDVIMSLPSLLCARFIIFKAKPCNLYIIYGNFAAPYHISILLSFR